MAKPIMFISHIHDDVHLATALKSWLSNIFLDGVNIFVASDGASIRGGDRWMEKIESALRDAKLFIAMISPKALGRGWIFFETGGAFFMGAKVIPLCVGGMKVAKLPAPLSFLQAYEIDNEKHIHRLVADVAEYVGLRCPQIDVRDFWSRIKNLGSQVSANEESIEGVAFEKGIEGFVDLIKTAHEPLIEEFTAVIATVHRLPSSVRLDRIRKWLTTKIGEIEQGQQRTLSLKDNLAAPFLEAAYARQLRNLRNALDVFDMFKSSGTQEYTEELIKAIQEQLTLKLST